MKYAKALPVHGRALRRLAENAGVTGFDEAAVQTPPSRSLATVHWIAAWEWVRIFESILYGKRQELRTIPAFGRSVIIGFQKTQIYQRFAGSRQEVFILKIQNDENNAAQQDNGRRFHI